MERASRAHVPPRAEDAYIHNIPVAQTSVRAESPPTDGLVRGGGVTASAGTRSDACEGSSSSEDVVAGRANSVSSISSARSTSSIEAVPFRAPPCGNVREPPASRTHRMPPAHIQQLNIHPSFAWNVMSTDDVDGGENLVVPVSPTVENHSNAQTQSNPSTPVLRTTHAETVHPNSSLSNLQDASALPPVPVSPTHSKHRIPKQSNARWMYRNGPGLSRRLPMLGPTVDDDTRWNLTHMSRPSSRNSLAVPDGASMRSYGSDTHYVRPMMERSPSSQPTIDEDTHSHRSSSSMATLSAQPYMEQLAAPPTELTVAAVMRDTSPQARTLHWLQNVRQHNEFAACELPDKSSPQSSTVDEAYRQSQMRISNRSSTGTIIPRSPSPRMPMPAESSILETPPPQALTMHAHEERAAGSDTSRASRRRTTSDFVFGEVLGEGSYSTVLKAWDVHDWPESERQALATSANAMSASAGQAGFIPPSEHMPKVYAVKVLDKVHILKEKKQKYVRVEKEALSLLVNTPGVVTLYHTFQDRESLYFVLELAPNCELLHYLQKYGSFDLVSATFYGAQLADAIDRIHRAGVVHRDIKPENVLLDANMRVLVTDFGSARVLGRPTDTSADGRAHSFVGTAEYVSPELLNDQTVGMPADWWAFGCVFFQMIAGHAPFRAANEYQTFQKILHRSFTYPTNFPTDARILIDTLLCLDPNARANAKDVKRNVIFHSIDFSRLWTVQPPKIQPDYMQRPRQDGHQTVMEELDNLMNELSYQREDSSVSQERSTMTDDSSVASGPEISKLDVASPRARSSSLPAHRSNMWNEVLSPSEDVAFASPMLLRRAANTGMFARKCQIILTTRPRLLCIKESARSIQVLADIPLHPPDARVNDVPASHNTPSTPAVLVRSDSRRSGHSQSRLQRSQSFKAPMHAITRTLGLRKDDDAAEKGGDAGSPADDADMWPVHVEPRGSRGFVIQTPLKQWQFEDPAGDAPFWVQNIQDALQSSK